MHSGFNQAPGSHPPLILITGMSGAGRRTAAAALEEMGWYVADNLPPSLIMRMVELSFTAESPVERLAIVTDVRSRAFAGSLSDVLNSLSSQGQRPILLYLEATDESLIARFDTVRRSHPLQEDGSLQDGLNREREMLADIKRRADIVVDTTGKSIHDLRRILEQRFSDIDNSPVRVTLQSFGFKHGAPRDMDVMMDARFLPNPYWIPELRDCDGTDETVADFVLHQPGAMEFLQSLNNLLLAILPGFRHEGKSFVAVGIGCTGGKHRSVALTEALASRLREDGIPVTVSHRDIDRH